MKFNHAVVCNGKFYRKGEEVPVKEKDSKTEKAADEAEVKAEVEAAAEAVETVAEAEVAETAETAKATTTRRKGTRSKTKAADES